MIEAEEIITKKIRVNPPAIKGIYFLMWRKKFAYIGQGVDCYRRINTHRSNLKLAFDSYFIIRTPDFNKKERECLEAKYIAKFLPKHNKKDRPFQEVIDLFNKNYTSIDQLCQRTNLPFKAVNNFIYNRYGTSRVNREILMNALKSP